VQNNTRGNQLFAQALISRSSLKFETREKLFSAKNWQAIIS
jgi:hypothetical protein